MVKMLYTEIEKNEVKFLEGDYGSGKVQYPATVCVVRVSKG